MRELSSNNCKLGWLAVGGGGYNPVNVARLWTLFLSIILDEKITNTLPEEFIQQCDSMGFTKCPLNIRDEDEVVQMYFSREEVTLDLERTIRRVKELVFPYHGL